VGKQYDGRSMTIKSDDPSAVSEEDGDVRKSINSVSIE